MLSPAYTKQFEKDIQRLIRRGTDICELKEVMVRLMNGEKVHGDYWDHVLPGSYRRHREVHIENDVLLLYKLSGTQIIFERTGADDDLF